MVCPVRFHVGRCFAVRRFRASLILVAFLVGAFHSCNFGPGTSIPPFSGPAASALPPAQSSTPSPAHTVTATLQGTAPSSTCAPLDLDEYLDRVSPLLDRLVAAQREATQLRTLPADRLAALAQATEQIQEGLSRLEPSRDLRDAHAAAVQAATLLRQALEQVGVGDYANAEATLRTSFERSALAIALIGMQYGQRTRTPAPTP